MSGPDGSEVRYAIGGGLSVGSLTAADPADLTTALPSGATGYTDLGYFEKGVSIDGKIETSEWTGWPAAAVVKRRIKGQSLELKGVMGQSNKTSTGLWFPGSTWNTTGTGGTAVSRMDIATAPPIDERKFVLSWDDGTVKNRLVLFRASISDRDAVDVNGDDPTTWGITIGALDKAGFLGFWLTNNPAMV